MRICKKQKQRIAGTLSELLWRMVEARGFVLKQSQFMDFRAIAEFLETNDARSTLTAKTITERTSGNLTEIHRVAHSEATCKKGES